MNHHLLRVFVCVVIVLVAGRGETKGQSVAPGSLQGLQTVAERSSYLSTCSAEQVREFLNVIDQASPLTTAVTLGKTTEGRSLDGIVMAREGTNPLPLPSDDPRLVVLIMGNIHSGECDGKEAILALMRDYLKDSERLNAILQKSVLIFLPNLNADGNARTGDLHRPGQVGPKMGMGTRENAAGLDLNRDFIKLDTSEIRSLIRVIDAWDVDVLFDAHTTNGSLHQYDLTYDIPHNPAANQAIISWMRKDFLPTVAMDLERLGTPIFYYGNFSKDHKRWESYGHEPRYSTEYMGLRGKIGILVESYSYASYQRRIEASYQFIDRCLAHLLSNSDKLNTWMRTSGTPLTSIPVQAKVVADKGVFLAKGYRWANPANPNEESRPPFPSPRDKDRMNELAKKDYEVELVNLGEATVSVAAPAYYFVPHEAAWVASRLRLHGVRMSEIAAAAGTTDSGKVKARTYRIKSIKKEPSYQARTPQKVEVGDETIDWNIQPGWVVPTNQPLGPLAVYLLEPHADDSLATWNFLDPAIKEGNVYPIIRLDSLPNGTLLRALPPLKYDELIPKDVKAEPLRLESLYAPGEKVSYLSAPTPMPRWNPTKDEYIIQNQNRWVSVECETGSMKPFELPTKLATALGKLSAFEEKNIARLRGSLSHFDSKYENALIEHKKELYVFQSRFGTVRQVTHDPKMEKLVPTLSPSGRHVAFVHGGNLWRVDCETTELKQLTTDGGGDILNGYLDWVYQEEVYGRGNFKSYWWSPDGNQIAFIRLDETPVPNFVINNSLSFAQTIENIRYPKAGQPNPHVTLHVVSVESGATQEIPLSEYKPDDRLVVRVGWSTVRPEEVVYQVQNRIQSTLDVWSYDTATKVQKKLVQETSEAWVDVIDEPRWFADGSFLWTSDAVGGRRHLYLVDSQGNRKPLTQGPWDVKEVVWASDDGKRVIFTAHRSSPINTDLLRLDVTTGEIKDIGQGAGMHSAKVHPKGDYLARLWGDSNHPNELWICDEDGNKLRRIDPLVQDRFEYVKSAAPETFVIPSRDGFEMQAMLYKPMDFEAMQKKGKLPVLIHVYAGPQAPTVQNAWTRRSDLWHRYLAEQGLPVLLCDNRSALGRGNSDTWKIYKNMASVELRDLEDTVAWLSKQDWVDSDRIGIWGWSYGGYFTAYAMTHTKLFRAGISGAPVTDWRNYDSIYTERYMSTPQLNPDGYKSSSVVDAANNLHGRMLLIHGEIDENVHMTNTMQLAHALQKAGKPFDLMIYPNNRHSVTDGEQQYHQYKLMTEFLMERLVEK